MGCTVLCTLRRFLHRPLISGHGHRVRRQLGPDTFHVGQITDATSPTFAKLTPRSWLGSTQSAVWGSLQMSGLVVMLYMLMTGIVTDTNYGAPHALPRRAPIIHAQPANNTLCSTCAGAEQNVIAPLEAQVVTRVEGDRSEEDEEKGDHVEARVAAA